MNLTLPSISKNRIEWIISFQVHRNACYKCQTQNFITVCFFSLHGCAALRWTCSIAGITNFLNHGHYEYRNSTAVKRHAVYINSSLSASGKIRLRANNCHSGYYRQLKTSQSTFQSMIFRFDTVKSCRWIQTHWRICCLHIQCSSLHYPNSGLLNLLCGVDNTQLNVQNEKWVCVFIIKQ